MRENLNQKKFILKGKIDSIEDDMTINVIGGTAKNPIPDSENLQDIAEKLFAFYQSLEMEDDTECKLSHPASLHTQQGLY